MAQLAISDSELRKLDDKIMNGEIIPSRLWDDKYKMTMNRFIRKYYPNIFVTWKFKNRTTSVRILDHVSGYTLEKELSKIEKLTYTEDELNWIKQTNQDNPMSDSEFIQELQDSRISPVTFEPGDDGQPKIDCGGIWADSSPSEIHTLRVVNTLYFRSILETKTEAERFEIYREGIRRLTAGVELLLDHPYVNFTEFGNRRSFNAAWHDFLLGYLVEVLPSTQLLGTSNMYLAKKYNIAAKGTIAHEMSMVIAALMFNGTFESLKESFILLHKQWLDFYQGKFNVMLTDTFGTKFAFEVLPDWLFKEYATFREDSMGPEKYTEYLIAKLNSLSIEPKDITSFSSDGLTVEAMIEHAIKFLGIIQTTYGPGTHLTNNLGIKPLSIVSKVHTADGKYCVKLSDNLEKATGDKETVDAVKRALGYKETHSEVCKV